MPDENSKKSFITLRKRMVEEQLRARDIADGRVLEAMGTIPRELFVQAEQKDDAYSDGPLPIGYEQTISQPYVVASMTQALALGSASRVLEIGTGSGYQTAVLCQTCAHVYTIEIVPELHKQASSLLQKLGFDNVSVRLGDGSVGWPEEAPFDGILVAAATPKVPSALLDQLGFWGRLVIPICLSGNHQELRLCHRLPHGIESRTLYDVRFVLMRGNVDSSEP
jgi:protein-L-isoaspartate(D-aspartate) O-methyltransferase